MKDPEATVQVSFRFANREKERISELGKRTGWTMSKLMNMMIRAGLDSCSPMGYHLKKKPPEAILNIRAQVENFKEEYEANELIAKGEEPVSLAGLLADVSVRLAKLESEVKRLNGEGSDN
tara:strand:- start:11992 stop:12354 length:363 start_codon:yes stop_codon:yes gene_type:complete